VNEDRKPSREKGGGALDYSPMVMRQAAPGVFDEAAHDSHLSDHLHIRNCPRA